jgi:hypothetical protein
MFVLLSWTVAQYAFIADTLQAALADTMLSLERVLGLSALRGGCVWAGSGSLGQLN